MAQVEEDARGLCVPGFITSRDSLEDYAQYVMDFATSLSRQHGRLQRLTPRSHSWWSPEVARAISSYRLALRGQRCPDDLLSARRQRNSTIRRAKAANFRGFIHQVAGEPQALWKMARWGRTASYTPPEPPAVPPLRSPSPEGQSLSESLPGPLTSSFLGKADLLRVQFFPDPDPADLADIPVIPRQMVEGPDGRLPRRWPRSSSLCPTRRPQRPQACPTPFLKQWVLNWWLP